MEGIDLILAAIPALGIGIPALWWLRAPKPPHPILKPDPAPHTHHAWPCQALPVLDAEDIIANTGMAPVLLEVRGHSGLTDMTWHSHILPVVQAVAAMAQQLPASEAHHHAQPGGLFVHSVETLGYVARLRQGRILPLGADIETQSRGQHLWTAGLYIAALLHDVGKTVTDLRVTLFDEAYPAGRPWQALLGTMREARAAAYVVSFPRAQERDYRAHQKIGIQLMQRLVPSDTRLWLGSDPILLEQFLGYLSGHYDNTLAELVGAAEAESVRRNLASGTRVRFASAQTTPLIELLMHALRMMLTEGGRLPLNRPGAAGFCDGTDVWFAAVRVANEVRDWLHEHHPDAPVPGETMNDRLFDTWQEYGACRTNPSTHGAVWSARIEFTGGQRFQLGALLRFPIDRLYPDPGHYPRVMDGNIVVTPHVGRDVTADDPQPELAEADSHAPPSAGLPKSSDTRSDSGRASVDGAHAGHTPRLPDVPRRPTVRPCPRDAEQVHPRGTQPIRDAEAAPAVADGVPARGESMRDFLEEEDAALALPILKPNSAKTPEPPRLLGAVVPHVALPSDPLNPGKSGKRGATPSDAALRFMGWLQQGLADGSLPYNTTSALVHFVKVILREREETMMLLVSPAVFRRFAEVHGDLTTGSDTPTDVTPGKLGMGIQMAFSQAGWQQPAARGRNIHRFQVIRRGDTGGSLLNGFLVREPERFVNPVPPANERLRYWSQSVAPGIDKANQG